LLQKTSYNSKNHDNLSSKCIWALGGLLDDAYVTQSDLKEVNVVSNGSEIGEADLDDSGTIVVHWVKETSTESSQEPVVGDSWRLAEVDGLDVSDQSANVNDVDGCTEELSLFGVGLPFELEELLDS
jgi:hypothetical protein